MRKVLSIFNLSCITVISYFFGLVYFNRYQKKSLLRGSVEIYPPLKKEFEVQASNLRSSYTCSAAEVLFLVKVVFREEFRSSYYWPVTTMFLVNQMHEKAELQEFWQLAWAKPELFFKCFLRFLWIWTCMLCIHHGTCSGIRIISGLMLLHSHLCHLAFKMRYRISCELGKDSRLAV